MRLLLSIFAALMLSVSGAAANGPKNFYAEGFGGLSAYPDLEWDGSEYELDNGYFWGAALGLAFINNLSLELEYMQTSGDYESYDAELTTQSLMANVLFLYAVNNVMTYGGFGLGGVDVGVEYSSYDYSEWVFGWQLMAGVMFPLANNVSLFGEYRFQNASDADLGSWDNTEYRAHLFGGGVRVGF